MGYLQLLRVQGLEEKQDILLLEGSDSNVETQERGFRTNRIENVFKDGDMKFPQIRCIFEESKDLKRVWRGVVAKLEDVTPKVSSENWVS